MTMAEAAALSPRADRTRVVVIGGSLARLRAAEALRRRGYRGRLSIVGEEVHAPYDRPPLSKSVLAGTALPASTALPIAAELDAEWIRGHRATAADFARHSITLDDERELVYDGLVAATGARPRMLSTAIERTQAPTPHGVHVLRTLDAAVSLRDALRQGPRRVAILGAGFIGTEVAATARVLGHAVTLIDSAPLPLWHAVGPHVGQHCAELHHRRGVDLHLGASAEELETVNANVTGIRLQDGTLIEADLVVVGLGAQPNTEWLTGSGARIDDGLHTDAFLRVINTQGEPIPGVVAAGDLVRAPHPLFDDQPVRTEHWSNAGGQAQIAAQTLLAHLRAQTRPSMPELAAAPAAPEPFAAVPTFWSDQYETTITSVGLPHLAEHSTVIDSDTSNGTLVVGYERAGRMVGAVAINQPRPLGAYRRHIAAGGTWPPPTRRPAGPRRTASTRSSSATPRTKNPAHPGRSTTDTPTREDDIA